MEKNSLARCGHILELLSMEKEASSGSLSDLVPRSQTVEPLDKGLELALIASVSAVLDSHEGVENSVSSHLCSLHEISRVHCSESFLNKMHSLCTSVHTSLELKQVIDQEKSVEESLHCSQNLWNCWWEEHGWLWLS